MNCRNYDEIFIRTAVKVLEKLILNNDNKNFLHEHHTVAQGIISIIIRILKVKQYWPRVVFGRIAPFKWTEKTPMEGQRVVLIKLHHRQMLDFEDRSSGYQSGEEIPNAKNQKCDDTSPDYILEDSPFLVAYSSSA